MPLSSLVNCFPLKRCRKLSMKVRICGLFGGWLHRLLFVPLCPSFPITEVTLCLPMNANSQVHLEEMPVVWIYNRNATCKSQ